MGIGAAGWTPGTDVFSPDEFATAVLWVAMVYAPQKTLLALP